MKDLLLGGTASTGGIANDNRRLLGAVLRDESNPKKNEFVGDEEANSLRSRPERNCWA